MTDRFQCWNPSKRNPKNNPDGLGTSFKGPFMNAGFLSAVGSNREWGWWGVVGLGLQLEDIRWTDSARLGSK